jgi:hypothetical protein
MVPISMLVISILEYDASYHRHIGSSDTGELNLPLGLKEPGPTADPVQLTRIAVGDPLQSTRIHV